jgi:uncharacterized membrane protein HdeD (DUF308 family)
LTAGTENPSPRNGQQAVGLLSPNVDDVRSNIMNGVPAEQLWKETLAVGVLTAILGGMVLAWPGPSILVAATLFGLYLLVSGIADLFLSFTLPRSAAARVLLFIAGALSVVLAILSFRHFGEGYADLLLSLCIGVGFTFLGVSEVAVAGSLPTLPGRGWYIVLGIISVIAGVVVLAWPFDSIVLLAIVTGVCLILIGVIQIVQAFQIRKDAKAARQTLDAVSERVHCRPAGDENSADCSPTASDVGALKQRPRRRDAMSGIQSPAWFVKSIGARAMTDRTEFIAVTRQELSTGCRNRADANVVGLAGLEQLNLSRPSHEVDTPNCDLRHRCID